MDPTLVMLIATPLCLLLLAGPPSVAAQEDEGFGDPAAEAAAPPPASDDGSTTSTARQESWLTWGMRSLGIGYSVIFLLLSVTLVALFVMNLLTARRENVCPRGAD